MTLLTDDLRSRIGTEVTYTAPEPLGRAAIRYYARALGDENPLYVDDVHARKHGYDGVVAPPTLIFDTNQYTDLPRTAEGYAGHAWDLEVPGTSLVRGGNAYEIVRPVTPEDVLSVTWRITAMSERMSRAQMPMLVVTSEARYRDQRGELLAVNVETLIYVGRSR